MGTAIVQRPARFHNVMKHNQTKAFDLRQADSVVYQPREGCRNIWSKSKLEGGHKSAATFF